MRHTFFWVRVHLVWSTYRREPWIEPAWQERLYRCLSDVARRKGARVLCAGGARDHVHVYVSLAAGMSVAYLVDALKANSSRWVHETFPRLKLFAWQKGYAAFSVCKRCEGKVISYIRSQEAHHRPTREGAATSWSRYGA
jgi:putative transposase